ncbi:VWA domain-containing protein [Candidatus Woesearchaeota archaeon]|nr:VWA domain-containing protein [Candidatus Woesearchaeota archaeon]
MEIKTRIKRINKKGFYFTLDALFASIILIGGLLLISQHLIKEHPRESIEYLSTDILVTLSNLKMGEVNNTFVNVYLMGSPNTDLNLSVLEQLGTYWATNETDLAINLSEYLLVGLFPNNTGMDLVIESDTLFEKPLADSTDLVTGERMITGIMEGAPLTGSTSSAYLRRIDEKRTSSFLYFGGFVGQGNISLFIDDIPGDVDSSVINKIEMEVDAGTDFSLYINGDHCDDFTPNDIDMTPDYWDITHCNTSVTSGLNTFDIFFSGEMNESYIAGGYIKISYKTSEQIGSISTGEKTYDFPGIDGIANLYDSFYISGTLTNMSIYLHFDSDARTYLTIGSTTVYQDNITGETQVYLNDTDLTQFPVNLNYDSLSNKTIPIKFASYNETYITVFGTNADVILITDLSGSMKCRMGQWNCPPEGFSIPSCDKDRLQEANARRLAVAACLDSDVNAIIMNSSRTNNTNRLWLVDFSDNANPFFPPPPFTLMTEADIENEIDTRYKSRDPKEISGGTCLCCAINQAYEVLANYSNENRTKSVIVMTDGIPTHCCGVYWDGGWKCNETSIGTSGIWVNTDCTGAQSECADTDCNPPINNSINAAKRLHDDLNVTVYAVGFGPLEDCERANYTVHEIAEAGNGSVLVSMNGSELQDFYQNISNEIVAKASQSSQIVIVEGNITPSKLFNDSYINFTYIPIIDPPEPNEISVVVQTDQFGECTPDVTIPGGIRIADAKVVSYSDYHWTDILKVNTTTVYNLSFFSYDYSRLGDPYQVQVPVYLLTNGTHTLTIETGDDPVVNRTGCSDNNSLIYTALVPSATARSEVVEKTEGCNWTIQFEDDTFSTKPIPADYAGTKKCSYTETNHTLADGAYDPTDAYDVAVFGLLDALDFDNNGKVFVNLDAADIEIVLTTVSSVPYMWGPTLIKAKVWQ